MSVVPFDVAAVASAAFSAVALILVAIVNGRTRRTSDSLGRTNHGSDSLGEAVDDVRDEVAEIKRAVASLTQAVRDYARDFRRLEDRVDDNRDAADRSLHKLELRVESITSDGPSAKAP